jgi:hypothetical protein
MFDRMMLHETSTAPMPAVKAAGSGPAGRHAARQNHCAKCGGLMQTGFIVDRSYGSNFQEEWVQGRPRSFLYRVILRGAPRQKVLTYRCATCGYLESYARLAACPKCGCDLVGNTDDVCPECGLTLAACPVAKPGHISLEDTLRQAVALNGFWRVVRLLLACLPGGFL